MAAQDGPDRSVWFAGDLGDPWVVAIADALPPPFRRFDCPGDLPDFLADGAAVPEVLVLHRAVLTRFDAERVARLRASRSPVTRVVLCLGPYARHNDLERWSPLIDAVVPEATARETVARHLGPEAAFFPPSRVDGGPGTVPALRPRRAGHHLRVAVVSTNAALRQTLAEAVEASGYPVTTARDWHDAPGSGPAVWDVPLLEPAWSVELSRRTKVGPVVALLGFADRELVTQARAVGASACLELPFDLVDLASALDRLSPSTVAQPPHPTPPPPASSRYAAARTPALVRRVAETGLDA